MQTDIWACDGLVNTGTTELLYRVSIKSFPDYKQLLQENCVEYRHIVLPLLKLVSKTKILELHLKKRLVFHVVFL